MKSNYISYNVELFKGKSMEQEKNLIKEAIQAAKGAYAPYSGYHVGAALLTEHGDIYTGCNIENTSFGATNCAERTAFFKAVSAGEKDFKAIAIAGGPGALFADEAEKTDNISTGQSDRNHLQFPDYAYPCGICRQVMQEFCESDFKIIVAKSTEDYKKYNLKELLPFGFGGKAD